MSDTNPSDKIQISEVAGIETPVVRTHRGINCSPSHELNLERKVSCRWIRGPIGIFIHPSSLLLGYAPPQYTVFMT